MVSNFIFDRRSFLRSLVSLSFITLAHGKDLPSVRAITRGPRFHWFGYYDKLEFDPTSRYVLGMEVDFQHRSPKETDVIKVGMVDLEANDHWTELGESRAWCWQQGCMLQWLPGSKTEVIWNDRQGDRFVSHVLDVKSGKKRTLPGPIYAISPDGHWGISPDFSRLNDCRPGYGYAGLVDSNKNESVPTDSGVWRMDLGTGEKVLLFSLADVARIPNPRRDGKGAKHYFNHLLFSPDGRRFCFFHLWLWKDENYWGRLLTADVNGKELYLVDAGDTSHFWWRDPQHILAWAPHPSYGPKFYLFEDRTNKVKVVGPKAMTEDGHCSYLPDKRWILNDTYPDKERNQHPYLYNVARGKKYPLGHFYSPAEYRGEWRCDNHPRFSPDGRKVVIDSPHAGQGRQMYLIDISQLVNLHA
jgi:hypothetical protein